MSIVTVYGGILIHSPLSIIMNVPIEVVSTDPNVSLGLGSVADVVQGESAGSGRSSAGPSVNANVPGSDLQPAEGPAELHMDVGQAMKYLDQVKLGIGDKHEIYNHFLEIMKTFKSEGLETPEVINRVSQLFHGYPDLISGFATFLPPNYVLENDKVDDDSMETETSAVVSFDGTSVIREHFQHYTSREGGQQIIWNSVSSTLPIPTMSTVCYSHCCLYHHSMNCGCHNIENVPPPPSQDLPPIQPPSNHPSNVSNFETVGVEGSPLTHSLEFCLDPRSDKFKRMQAYVCRVKERLHAEPEKYMHFLDVLRHFQIEERKLAANNQSGYELLDEIYADVSKLLENHEDLLEDFRFYLKCSYPTQIDSSVNPVPAILGQNPTVINEVSIPIATGETQAANGKDGDKSNSPSATSSTPHQPRVRKVAAAPTKRVQKKSLPPAPKGAKSTGPTDTEKYEAIKEYGLFEKLLDFLGPKLYENFLRVLLLYHEHFITKEDVLRLIKGYLNKSPQDLLALCKVFIDISGGGSNTKPKRKNGQLKLAPRAITSPEEELSSEQDIDLSTCRRLGASYCARPKNHKLPKCSGRTPLCNDVLNDTWISAPKSTEDELTFTTSRKTQLEEAVYCLEDDRFELDMTIDSTTDTIRYLEDVSKKMSLMPSKELEGIQLDASLGGFSPTLQQRSIRRIYGEEAGAGVIEGLQKLPKLTVPIVLKRLKEKEEEWRKAQKGFNEIWADKMEEYYLKSLDHQGSHFKQADIRAFTSKSLITEIEVEFDKRQRAEGDSQGTEPGPHVSLSYENPSVFDDTCDLLLHNVRQHSGIQKESKRKINEILKHFIPDFFNNSRRELTDDEEEDGGRGTRPPLAGSSIDGNGSSTSFSCENNEKDEDCALADKSRRSPSFIIEMGSEDKESCIRIKTGSELKQTCNEVGKLDKVAGDFNEEEVNTERMEEVSNPQGYNENYHLFFASSCWYIFFRLHHILCERLAKLKEIADAKVCEASTSDVVKLGPLPKSKLDVKEYYSTFMEMMRNLLDGEMEANMFEHEIRDMFGIDAYFAFTLDRVVTSAVRQLQNLVKDEASLKCLDLYHQANLRGGSGGSVAISGGKLERAEAAYQQEAENAFGEEHCIKVVLFEKTGEMTMELLGYLEPPTAGTSAGSINELRNNRCESCLGEGSDDIVTIDEERPT